MKADFYNKYDCINENDILTIAEAWTKEDIDKYPYGKVDIGNV